MWTTPHNGPSTRGAALRVLESSAPQLLHFSEHRHTHWPKCGFVGGASHSTLVLLEYVLECSLVVAVPNETNPSTQNRYRYSSTVRTCFLVRTSTRVRTRVLLVQCMYIIVERPNHITEPPFLKAMPPPLWPCSWYFSAFEFDHAEWR